MSTLNFKPETEDANAVISFLNTVIDGYDHPIASERKALKRHIRKLKSFFNETKDKSAILSRQDNPQRVREAVCDKLHASAWRIHNALERHQKNPNTISALEDLRGYFCAAFHHSFQTPAEEALDAGRIVTKARADKAYPKL